MNKKVRANYIYNLIYQFVVILSPLIITPYTARILEVDGVGLNSGINAMCSNFVLFAVLGTSTYAIKYIGEVQDNPKARSERFWEIQIFRTITTIIVFLSYIFYVNSFGRDWLLYYIIYAILLINVIVDITWFFQGLEEFKTIVIRNIVVRIAFIFLVFCFVKTKNDLPLFMGLSCITTLLGSAMMWFSLPGFLRKVEISNLHPFANMRAIIILFLPTIAIQIYTVLDKTILLMFATDTVENGYYEQAEKIVKMSMTVITSLSTVLMPRISNLYSNNKIDSVKKYMVESYKVIWMLGIPLVVGMCSCARILIPVFLGGGYEKSIFLIYVLSPLVLIIGFSNAISMQFLVPTNNEKIFTMAAIIASCINLCIDLLLIPHIYSIGAAIGTVIAEMVALIIEIIFLIRYKYFGMFDFFNGITNYIVASFIMAIIIKFVRGFIPTNLLGLCLIIIVGILSYFIVLMGLRDTYVLKIVKIIENFLRNKKRGY